MILEGIKYKQIPEKHYKSCDGCAFEQPEQKIKCYFKTLAINVECDNKIWVKDSNPFEVINPDVAIRRVSDGHPRT